MYKPPYHNGKQVVCTCNVYDFPHRYGGGKCDGMQIAVNCFENKTLCRNCINLSSYGCDIINGIESPGECPAVHDFNHEYQVR